MADDLSILKTSPETRRQFRRVRRLVTHQNYEPEPNTHNDIAIIFVRNI